MYVYSRRVDKFVATNTPAALGRRENAWTIYVATKRFSVILWLSLGFTSCEHMESAVNAALNPQNRVMFQT